MFAGLSPLLLVGFSFLPTGGEKAERERIGDVYYSAFYTPSGKVLDVLESNQVLLSFGKNQGARKGMEMDIHRLDAKSAYSRGEYIGLVELVDVGAKHAIGRFRAKVKPAREDDIATLIYKMPPIPQVPLIPVWQQRGGAILDPEGLLKRK
jgi:hypothetical protein